MVRMKHFVGASTTRNDPPQTRDRIRCFIVFQILVFVAREEARYFLCCLSQISWVLTRNSLFALFSIELDK